MPQYKPGVWGYRLDLIWHDESSGFVPVLSGIPEGRLIPCPDPLWDACVKAARAASAEPTPNRTWIAPKAWDLIDGDTDVLARRES